MEQITCKVEAIIFRDFENGYTVCKCKSEKGMSLICNGTLPDVMEKNQIRAEGIWEKHKKYGYQFSVKNYEQILPREKNAVIEYLGSGMFKGIRKAYAERIYKAFGESTFDVLDKEPERLKEVSGISDKNIIPIVESWRKHRAIKNIMMFLTTHGISTNIAMKIFNQYGSNSVEHLKNNPYDLCNDVWGIGFKTADGIARSIGFEMESYVRIRNGIWYVLSEFAKQGHCFAPKTQLIEKAQNLLQVKESRITAAITHMKEDHDIVVEWCPEETGISDEAIYNIFMYYAEEGIAKKLTKIMRAYPSIDVDTDGLIGVVESETGMQYEGTQREAILAAVQNKVTVLTGGPGTGKTTTVLGIIKAFRTDGAKILLATPTGRAAKRMNEATGMPAKTIHRLLEYVPGMGFTKNANNKLTGDVLIVDECSMIDTELMYALLSAVPNHMTLVLVGDADQLPSVAPGNVLSDIIFSAVVPVIQSQRGSRSYDKERFERRFLFPESRKHEGGGKRNRKAGDGKTSEVLRYDNRKHPNPYAEKRRRYRNKRAEQEHSGNSHGKQSRRKARQRVFQAKRQSHADCQQLHQRRIQR